MRSLTHISHSSRLHRAVATAWRRRASDTDRSCASATTNGRNGQMAGEGVSSKPAFINSTMHGWGQWVVRASTICAYQKLHLILQEWLPSECNMPCLRGLSTGMLLILWLVDRDDVFGRRRRFNRSESLHPLTTQSKSTATCGATLLARRPVVRN